jgi:hypothetical protein
MSNLKSHSSQRSLVSLSLTAFSSCLIILGLSSCAVQPEIKESWVDLPKPRILKAKPAIEIESPSMMSQRMLDNHRKGVEPQRVGAVTLSTWMGSSSLQVWDLTSDRISKKYEPLPRSKKVVSSLAKASLGDFRGTLVLVSHDQGRDALIEAWAQLRDIPNLDVLVLDGGVEAWSALMEKQ